MPVCALCEHPQPTGEACDLCGRPLGASPPGPVASTAPLDDLEPTHHAPVAEPREAFDALEPTAAAPVEVSGPALEALEATGHPAVEEPTLDPFDLVEFELEPTLAEPVPDPAPRGPLLCRYCRAPAVGWERFCQRCGMRLAIPRPAAPAAPLAARCGDCGAALTGPLCPGCGARRPGG
jgi:hypothetical protein